MSKNNSSNELDKNQRINKHNRSHSKDHTTAYEKSLQPHHKPAKKQHINILDAYEKFGEKTEDLFEE